VAGINVGSGFTGNFLDFRKDGGLIARLSSDGNFECGQMLGLSGWGVRYDTGYNGVQCSNTDGMGISWSTSAAATSGKHVGIYGYQSEPGVVQVNSTVKGVFRDIRARMFKPDSTITAGGTTGAQTINKAAGSVNFAAAATSLVVTNSLVTASSIIIATIQTGDTTFTSIKAVVPASGSFTIYANAAATAETRVSFLVLS